MADRCLVWYIPKVLSNSVVGTNASTPYVLDEDYIPVRVVLRQKVAQGGNPTIIDINDDGTSIFDDLKPSLAQGIDGSEVENFARTLTYLAKDSVITLDVDQVSSTVPGEKLMVQLELDKA